VLAVGQISLLDSLLSMLLTGALVCFFFAHMADWLFSRRDSWPWQCRCWRSCRS
jgi:hypothetical protein